MAQARQLGQTQRREAGSAGGVRVRDAEQVGIGERQDDEIAGLLPEIDRRLAVVEAHRIDADQMHAPVSLPSPSGSSATRRARFGKRDAVVDLGRGHGDPERREPDRRVEPEKAGLRPEPVRIPRPEAEFRRIGFHEQDMLQVGDRAVLAERLERIEVARARRQHLDDQPWLRRLRRIRIAGPPSTPIAGRRICPGSVSTRPSPVNGRHPLPRRSVRNPARMFTTMSSCTLRAPAIIRTGTPPTSSYRSAWASCQAKNASGLIGLSRWSSIL